MSKTVFGDSIRSPDQEGGNNNVFAKGGIHYKSSSSLDLISPHNEWMVYLIIEVRDASFEVS